MNNSFQFVIVRKKVCIGTNYLLPDVFHKYELRLHHLFSPENLLRALGWKKRCMYISCNTKLMKMTLFPAFGSFSTIMIPPSNLPSQSNGSNQWEIPIWDLSRRLAHIHSPPICAEKWIWRCLMFLFLKVAEKIFPSFCQRKKQDFILKKNVEHALSKKKKKLTWRKRGKETERKGEKGGYL